MSESVYPLEIPVPLSHHRLAEFCSRIRSDGSPIAVPLSAELLPIDNCYWNVAAVVESLGGEIAFGWMIKYWPGLYLTAVHHAVWKSDQGLLVDVTHRQPTFEGPTTFVLDSNQVFDLTFPPNVAPEYFAA